MIHVGFPKTATTFIQSEVFEKMQGIHYLGKYESRKNTREKDQKKRLLPVYDYDDELLNLVSSDNWTIESANNYKNKLLRKKINKTLLLSYEGFSAPREFNNRLNTAERLFAVFPEAIVLFTIRNQFDWLKSSYYATMYNHDMNINEWLDAQESSYDTSWLRGIEIYDVLMKYMELFGEGNVKIILNEEIKSEKKVVSKKLKDILGDDVCSDSIYNFLINGKVKNSRPTIGNLIISKRDIKSIVLNPLLLFSFNKHVSCQLSPKWKKFIEDKVAKNNSEINQLFALNMQKYNYPLSY